VGLFTRIDKSKFALTTDHLVKYGYDPNPGSGGVVILVVVLIVFTVIIVGMVISANRRRTSW
jgi:hypothetical protein